VDYFDNVCEYEVRPTKPLPEFSQQNDIEEHATTAKIKPMFKPDAQQQQQTHVKHQDEAKKRTGCELNLKMFVEILCIFWH
jgi:hypothetical protein